MTKLTLFDITKSCKLHGGYKTAELNNVLYLHYSGLSSLCEMKGYNPSCIWLQGNQLVEVSHMMLSVTCLYLQKNAIMNINGLDGLINLVELNLSNNMIQEINNGLPENLETLYISKNLISESDKLKNLRGLKKLCLLDISNNQIKDDGVVMILSNLELRVVNTEQNPFHNKARYFRKELIRALPLLNYLNSKPVEEDERRIVNAFFMGGKAAELDEKSRILSEKAAENRRHYKSTCLSFRIFKKSSKLRFWL
eukprot:NODE_646_length_5582_cov_0.573044.p3 type:complete len:253 gc:universal NODE_646_length_5582_cov_0.573044:1042-284(-)